MPSKSISPSQDVVHDKMLRLIAGDMLEENVKKNPEEGLAKVEKSWWFNTFIIGIIIANLAFLATGWSFSVEKALSTCPSFQ